jgi:hypothetical protein
MPQETLMTFRTYVLVVTVLVSWSHRVCAVDPEWQSLLPHVDVSRDAVAGAWRKSGHGIVAEAKPGARLALPEPPGHAYDFRVSFTRRAGEHSIAMVFVHGGRQATFEVDAWGRHLGGIQEISRRDLRQNGTQRDGVVLESVFGN